MLGIGRRTALAGSRRAASTPCTRAVKQFQPLLSRDFHLTQTNAASRPTWLPMRVKTPWIDALTKAREDAADSKGKAPMEHPKPDLTPRRMSDSYYCAVSMQRSRKSEYSADQRLSGIASGSGQMAVGLVS